MACCARSRLSAQRSHRSANRVQYCLSSALRVVGRHALAFFFREPAELRDQNTGTICSRGLGASGYQPI